jgi:hypothetical protein
MDAGGAPGAGSEKDGSVEGAGSERDGSVEGAGSVESTGSVEGGVFREALRHHAGGVAVVTVAGPEGPRGFTATSLTAASLRPPLLSFYVNHDSWEPGTAISPRCSPAGGRTASRRRRGGAADRAEFPCWSTPPSG